MWKKLSTWKMWRKSVMWRNYVYNLWCFVALNCCKISFLAIYAVLSRSFLSRFTHFCVEKNWAKNCVSGEKGQISCMLLSNCYTYYPPEKILLQCVNKLFTNWHQQNKLFPNFFIDSKKGVLNIQMSMNFFCWCLGLSGGLFVLTLRATTTKCVFWH